MLSLPLENRFKHGMILTILVMGRRMMMRRVVGRRMMMRRMMRMRMTGRTLPKEGCQGEENKAAGQVGAGPKTRSPQIIIIVVLIVVVVVVVVVVVNIIIDIIIIIIGAGPGIRSPNNPLKSKRDLLGYESIVLSRLHVAQPNSIQYILRWTR